MRPEASVPLSTSASPVRIAIFCGAFTGYALFAPDHIINGDAAVYAKLIRDGDFSRITIHLGYYVVAYPFSYLPMPLEYTLNLLNCAFGAAIIVLVGLVGEAITKFRHVGLLASLLTFLNTLFAQNALHAEVYASQTFFSILAIYLWQTRKSGLAGMSAAVSFLISASTALAAPFFIVMRPRLKPLLQFTLLGAGIVAVALYPVLDDYLFSERGLVIAIKHGVDYRLALLKSGRDLFLGFYAFLPILITGMFECWRRNRRFSIALVLLWISVFVFGEKYTDVPVQLPTYVLASIIAAIGTQRISRKVALGAILLVLPILAAGQFAPSQFSHHLPSALDLTVYAIALVALGAFGRKALMVVIAANLFLVVKEAPMPRRQHVSAELNDWKLYGRKMGCSANKMPIQLPNLRSP